MAASEALGIKDLHAVHYYVADATRSQHFYENCFGWQPTWRAGAEMCERAQQTSTVYQAGNIKVAVSAPTSATSTGRAARYLSRHPAGIGSLTFEVEDVEKTWAFLAERGGTFIHRIRTSKTPDGGQFRHFSVTTALGDVAFRFCDRRDTDWFATGFERLMDADQIQNPLGFKAIDHVTCNAQTMASMALWFEHVLGFEPYWDIEFHTEDIRKGAETGTGLKSVVFWDPRSQLKFPINEPLAPFFKEGQINRFIEDNWGAGVQHIALDVDDAMHVVKTLRERKVDFLHTPGNYYDSAPARLAEQDVNVERLAHKLGDLAELGILIDGSPVDNYLIQIFLKDAMSLYDEAEAGPFFYEIIQRCGDNGFGGGNFRALFEAIERDQLGYEK
jgi:4-hydroxyphenylpyruvate dioxygenase